MFLFKFQYDNTLRILKKYWDREELKFKFQYDNTLSLIDVVIQGCEVVFKFQYDNTLRRQKSYSN